ncbi:hypothetical protein F511_15750 [Dorcoceras hygrometricum]|uniref:Uncharacterized protein n=1 Tax=Dorcoceras hygrometricum TaxID=472368 RepID=A0A2Z7BEQ0_9LAMI|nr:hypothetical protein F511_15750 [Dorcoceras hygrometricum]
MGMGQRLLDTVCLDVCARGSDEQSIAEANLVSSDGSTVYRSPSPQLLFSNETEFDQPSVHIASSSMPSMSVSDPVVQIDFIQRPDSPNHTDSPMRFDSDDISLNATSNPQIPLPVGPTEFNASLNDLGTFIYSVLMILTVRYYQGSLHLTEVFEKPCYTETKPIDVRYKVFSKTIRGKLRAVKPAQGRSNQLRPIKPAWGNSNKLGKSQTKWGRSNQLGKVKTSRGNSNQLGKVKNSLGLSTQLGLKIKQFRAREGGNLLKKGRTAFDSWTYEPRLRNIAYAQKNNSLRFSDYNRKRLRLKVIINNTDLQGIAWASPADAYLSPADLNETPAMVKHDQSSPKGKQMRSNLNTNSNIQQLSDTHATYHVM